MTRWHHQLDGHESEWTLGVGDGQAPVHGGLACCNSVQSLSHVRLLATPWIAARQASLSITNSWSSPKLMSIESVMPSSHLILCYHLLLMPPTPPSIRVFPMSQLFAWGGQVLEFQLQHHSFQRNSRADLLHNGPVALIVFKIYIYKLCIFFNQKYF